MKNKEFKIGIVTNTRKLSKILDIIGKHVTAVSEELKEMDAKGCPECGSVEFRVEHELEFDEKEFKDVKCMECGYIYLIENGEVELLHRK